MTTQNDYQPGDAIRAQMLKEAGFSLEEYKKACVSVEEFIKLVGIRKPSTQNDEIEVEGETYTKWDTQTNWKVEDRIRFLLENLIIDVGVQVTDDYKEKNGLYEGMSIENAKSRDKYTILFAELLADARREVIKRIESMPDKDVRPEITVWLEPKEYCLGYNKALQDVLATLREEETKE